MVRRSDTERPTPTAAPAADGDTTGGDANGADATGEARPTAATESGAPRGVEPARSIPDGLDVGAVVAPGAVVGLDDSASVLALAAELLAARPAVVGTASLAAVLSLSASALARSGAVLVRLFGGEHRDGTFTGTRSMQALTSSRCDVALVEGLVVGDEVHVPERTRDGRLGLVLAARQTYLVPAAAGSAAGDGDGPDGWVRLAALTDFAGLITPPDPSDRARAA